MERRYKYADITLLVVSFYCLFVWRKWKLVNAPSIDGIPGTNEIYVIAVVCFILLTLQINKFQRIKIPSSHPGVVFIILVVFVLFRNLLLSNLNSQNIYAVAVSFLPMMLAVLPQDRAKENIGTIIIPLSLLLSLYALFGIFIFFQNNQLRLYLPLGVATTLAFLFIIAIPIINLGITLTTSKFIKMMLRIGFWATILACVLTMSRSAIPLVGILATWCLFESSNKQKVATKLFGFVMSFMFVAFVISMFVNVESSSVNFSRLFWGFSDSSTSERKNAVLLGLEIHKNNYFFGAGNGTYFTRIYTFTDWTDKLITAYGKVGLLDPHNGFVLLLSENGIVGFALFSAFMVKIVKRFRCIGNRPIKLAGFQILIGMVLYSLTSSDMFSVVGLSSVVWYVIGSFVSFSYSK